MRISDVNAALRRVPPAAVYLAGLLPLAWIVALTVSGDIGVDPVAAIEHRLGKVALWFIAGGLAVTPLMRHTGLRLIRYRRAVGLLAFLYLCLHMAAWAVLDMGLLWSQIVPDLVKRPYLYIGLSAFILLTPLALTSNDLSVRRLGPRWRRLHRLVYPAAFLAVMHYVWQMKVITVEGWMWLLAILLLLAMRLPILKPVWGR